MTSPLRKAIENLTNQQLHSIISDMADSPARQHAIEVNEERVKAAWEEAEAKRKANAERAKRFNSPLTDFNQFTFAQLEAVADGQGDYSVKQRYLAAAMIAERIARAY